MTLNGLKIRIFAFRSLFKKGFRKLVLLMAIGFAIGSVTDVIIMHRPELAKTPGYVPHPILLAVAAVTCLMVYWLLDRMRG